MARRRLAAGLGALFIALGAWQFAEAGYIHAKAWLGQVLIDGAWARTLDGERRVRPWPWADTWPVARITVPSHGKRITALAGGSGRTLAWGPGHVDGSVLPGQAGISIIGGHRDTHFRFLEDIAPGEEILVEDQTGTTHRFRVTATEVVDLRTTRLDPVGETPRLVLVTCYPFDALTTGGPLRYLVFAEKIETVSKPVASAG